MLRRTHTRTVRWAEYCARKHPSLQWRHENFDVPGGTIQLTHLASETSVGPPIVMIPGWASTLETWSRCIAYWLHHRPIVVIHTREKSSAHMARTATQHPDQVIADVAAAVRSLAQQPAWVFGASTGANIAAELYRTGVIPAATPLALLLPHQRIRVPGIIHWVQHLPTWAFAVVKPCALRLLRPLALSTKHAAQYRDLFTELENSDVRRLAVSAAAWSRYRFAPSPSVAAGPRFVLGVPEDSFHPLKDAQTVAEQLQAKYGEIPGFARAHTHATARLIDQWATAQLSKSITRSTNE